MSSSNLPMPKRVTQHANNSRHNNRGRQNAKGGHHQNQQGHAGKAAAYNLFSGGGQQGAGGSSGSSSFNQRRGGQNYDQNTGGGGSSSSGNNPFQQNNPFQNDQFEQSAHSSRSERSGRGAATNNPFQNDDVIVLDDDEEPNYASSPREEQPQRDEQTYGQKNAAPHVSLAEDHDDGGYGGQPSAYGFDEDEEDEAEELNNLRAENEVDDDPLYKVIEDPLHTYTSDQLADYVWHLLAEMVALGDASPTYEFPASLSNQQRKDIHIVAQHREYRELIQHESFGQRDVNRFMVIWYGRKQSRASKLQELHRRFEARDRNVFVPGNGRMWTTELRNAVTGKSHTAGQATGSKLVPLPGAAATANKDKLRQHLGGLIGAKTGGKVQTLPGGTQVVQEKDNEAARIPAVVGSQAEATQVFRNQHRAVRNDVYNVFASESNTKVKSVNVGLVNPKKKSGNKGDGDQGFAFEGFGQDGSQVRAEMSERLDQTQVDFTAEAMQADGEPGASPGTTTGGAAQNNQQLELQVKAPRKHSLAEARTFLNAENTMEITHAAELDLDDDDGHLDIYCIPNLIEHSFAKVLAYYNMSYVEEYKREEARVAYAISRNIDPWANTNNRKGQGKNQRLSEADFQQMKQTVTSVFERFIKTHGFLTIAHIQGQLDNLAWAQQMHPSQILNLPQVGALLKGLIQVSFVVDTTCQVAFSCMALMTLHDLRIMIERNPVIKSQESLNALGRLEYHPLVRRNFQLNLLPTINNSSASKIKKETDASLQPVVKFPELSTERLMGYLIATIPAENWDEHQGDTDWTIETGLKKVAQIYKKANYLDLGVFVQRQGLVRTIMRKMKKKFDREQKVLEEAINTRPWKLAKLQRSNFNHAGKENQLMLSTNVKQLHDRVKEEQVHVSHVMRWEHVFRAFEKCQTYGLRLEFCEALCARDLGLDFRRSFKSMHSVLANFEKSAKAGTDQVAELVNKVQIVLAQKEQDLDTLVDRFVKHSVSPLLFMTLANIIPLTKAAAKMKKQSSEVWNKSSVQKADNLRKLYLNNELKRRVLASLDKFPKQNADLLEILAEAEQAYLEFLRCSANSEAPVSVLEYLVHAGPVIVLSDHSGDVAGEQHEAKTLREILSEKLLEQQSTGGVNGSAGTMLAIGGSGSNAVLATKQEQRKSVPTATSKASGLLVKSSSSGLNAGVTSTSSQSKTGPPGAKGVTAVSETAFADHLIQLLTERVDSCVVAVAKAKVESGVNAAIGEELELHGAATESTFGLSEFLEWVSDCESLLQDQYGHEAVKAHSVVALLAEQYGYKLADLLVEKNCLIAGPNQLCDVRGITNGKSKEGGAGKAAKTAENNFSNNDLKWWKNIGLLLAAQEEKMPEPSKERVEGRLRAAMQRHYFGGSGTSNASSTSSNGLDLLLKKCMPDLSGRAVDVARLEEARFAASTDAVPRLAMMLTGRNSDSQTSEKQDATALKKMRTDALTRLWNTPLMMDVAAANPDWSEVFAPFVGSIAEFCATLQSEDLKKFQTEFLEVKAGVYFKIGDYRTATGSDELRRSLFEDDNLRSAVAVVVRRFVRENIESHYASDNITAGGSSSTVEMFGVYEKEVAEYYASIASVSSKFSNPESVALRFANLIPYELLAVSSELDAAAVADVFLRPYVKLRRPRTLLLAETAGSPNDRVLVLELGKKFGITEWTLPKEDFSKSFVDSRAREGFLVKHRLVSATTDDGPPSKKRKLAEVQGSAIAAPALSKEEQLLAAQAAKEQAETSKTAKPTELPEQAGKTDERTPGSEQAPPSNLSNETLCTEIARVKGVPLQDVDPVSRHWLREPQDERIRSLQKTLQGAVSRLAADLYSGESHFVLELLQNADDCSFSDEVVPALCITVADIDQQKQENKWTTFPLHKVPGKNKAKALLIAEHCEEGFQAKDVRALCDIAQSTKTNKKFIGHKGVGFKSVFKVTKTPIIHSGAFSFHFDCDALNGLGYLVPFPLARPAQNLSPDVTSLSLSSASTSGSATAALSSFKNRGTRTVLPLLNSLSSVQLVGRLTEDLQPRLLLFLRKLQRLVLAHEGYFKIKMQKNILFDDASSSILALETLSTTSGTSSAMKDNVLYSSPAADRETWFVYTESLVSPTDRGNADSELKIAIPVPDVNSYLQKLQSLEAVDSTVPDHDAIIGGFISSPLNKGGSSSGAEPDSSKYHDLQKNALITEQQHVFAWLPTRSYGFRFVIQADFAVATSREALTSTDAFNQFLRDHVPAAFAKAVRKYIEIVGKNYYELAVNPSKDEAAFLALQSPWDDEDISPAAGTRTLQIPAEGKSANFDTHLRKRKQVLHLMLSQLYQVIPLPNEGLEFFQRTPRAVLAALESVPFLFVRKAGKSPSSTSASTRLFAAPHQVLRARLPPTIAAGARQAFGGLLRNDGGFGGVMDNEESRIMQFVEPLVNACNLFYLACEVPEPLAQAVNLKSLDGAVALQCLEQLNIHNSTEDILFHTTNASERNNTLLLHRALLLLIAFEDKPDIQKLKTLKIIPVKRLQDEIMHTDPRSSPIQYVSIQEEQQSGRSIYDAEFLVSLEKVRVLDTEFREFVNQEPRLGVLLQRLGVQKLDSQHFCEQHVLPVLLDNSPDGGAPDKEKLLACTLYLKKLLIEGTAASASTSDSTKAHGSKTSPATDAGKATTSSTKTSSKITASSRPRAMPAAKRADLVEKLRKGSPWLFAQDDKKGETVEIIRLKSAQCVAASTADNTHEEHNDPKVVHAVPLLPALRTSFNSSSWWRWCPEVYVDHEAEQGDLLEVDEATASWRSFWVELGVWPSLAVDADDTGKSSEFAEIVNCLEKLAENPAGATGAEAESKKVTSITSSGVPKGKIFENTWLSVMETYFVNSGSSRSHHVFLQTRTSSTKQQEAPASKISSYYADETRFSRFHEQLRKAKWLLNVTGDTLRSSEESWLSVPFAPHATPARQPAVVAAATTTSANAATASKKAATSTTLKPLPKKQQLFDEKHRASILADNTNALERPYILHPAVKLLHQLWPTLFLLENPSAEHLVRIIQDLNKAGPGAEVRLSIRDCTNLYSHLAHCVAREKIKKGDEQEQNENIKDTTAQISASPDSSFVSSFLATHSWVWVPNHPRLLNQIRFSFDDRGVGKKMPGKFYALDQLCFYDEARLLDSYNSYVSDSACDVARKYMRKRCVGNYYWGPKSVLPKPKKERFLASDEQNRLHHMLADWGVVDAPQWPDFFKVLHGVAHEMTHEEDAVLLDNEATTALGDAPPDDPASSTAGHSSQAKISFPDQISRVVLETEDAVEVVERVVEHLRICVRIEIQALVDENRVDGEMDQDDDHGMSALANSTGKNATSTVDLRRALDALLSEKPQELTPEVLEIIHNASEVLKAFVENVVEKKVKIAPTMTGSWKSLVLPGGKSDSSPLEGTTSTSPSGLFLPAAPYWAGGKEADKSRPHKKFNFRYDLVEPYVLAIADHNKMRDLIFSAWRLLHVPLFQIEFERLATAGDLLYRWDGRQIPAPLLATFDAAKKQSNESGRVADDQSAAEAAMLSTIEAVGTQQSGRPVSLQAVVFDLRTTRRRLFHADFSVLEEPEREKLAAKAATVLLANCDALYLKSVFLRVLQLSLDLFDHGLAKFSYNAALRSLNHDAKGKLRKIAKALWEKLQDLEVYVLQQSSGGKKENDMITGEEQYNYSSAGTASATGAKKISKQRCICLPAVGAGGLLADAAETSKSFLCAPLSGANHVAAADSFTRLQEIIRTTDSNGLVSLYDVDNYTDTATLPPSTAFDLEPFVGVTATASVECALPFRGNRRAVAQNRRRGGAATSAQWSPESLLLEKSQVFASKILQTQLQLVANEFGRDGKTISGETLENFWHYFCTRCFEPVAAVLVPELLKNVPASGISEPTEKMLRHPEAYAKEVLIPSWVLEGVQQEVRLMEERIDTCVRSSVYGKDDKCYDVQHSLAAAMRQVDGQNGAEEEGAAQHEDEGMAEDAALPDELASFFGRESTTVSAFQSNKIGEENEQEQQKNETERDKNFFQRLIYDAYEHELAHRARLDAEQKAAREQARQQNRAKRSEGFESFSQLQLGAPGTTAGASSSVRFDAVVTENEAKRPRLSSLDEPDTRAGVDFTEILEAKKQEEEALRQLKLLGSEEDADAVVKGPPRKMQKTEGALSRIAEDAYAAQQHFIQSRRNQAMGQTGAQNAPFPAQASQRVMKQEDLRGPGDHDHGGSPSFQHSGGSAGPEGQLAKNKSEQTGQEGDRNAADSMSLANDGGTTTNQDRPVDLTGQDFQKLLTKKDKDLMFRIKHQKKVPGERHPQNAEVRQEQANPQEEGKRKQLEKKIQQNPQNVDPEVQNLIGELGEQQAKTVLMKMGYAVLWLNEFDEAGLPFDFIIRKADQADFASEDRLSDVQRYFSELVLPAAGGATKKFEINDKRLQELFLINAAGPGTGSAPAQRAAAAYILVEVKATPKKQRDVFEVSLQELVAAWRWSDRYWILRIENVVGQMRDVRFIKNVPIALQQDDCKLYMMCS
ncbi:unnamed protein product [Amoebophrya sp. A120]|nr:unnamed protein product [Amoebophrya sp. A120]|eukprot:GSA120T00016618001.1